MRTVGAIGAALAIVAGAALFTEADEAARKPGPLPGVYVGEATCKKCHFKQDKAWKTTGHAKAHEILPAKYKDDPACTICHTTGHGQSGGFESTAKTPTLGGVQCEMCHGPGATHVEFAKANEAKKDDPEVKAKLRADHASAAEACVRCHVMQTHAKHPEFEKEGGK